MSNMTISHNNKAIVFTAQRCAELGEWPLDSTPLRDDEVAGATLTTLVSPGTEVNACFDLKREKPGLSGYAAIFEVEAVGSGVTSALIGQRMICMGHHRAYQRHRAVDCVPVPEGLSVEEAAFARLLNISWCTLTTTTARPPDRVLVLGLGVVGNLAAQIFQSAGYRVSATDPSELRRSIAVRSGIADVRATALEQPDLTNQVALAIDCSGVEQAVLDACKIVRKRGEVVLVGVPWKKRSDVSAFDMLHAVFHRYIVLRSGWEGELPWHSRDFSTGSVIGNMTGAMRWLVEKRVAVDGLYRLASPRDAQAVYTDLLEQRGTQLSVIFDWRDL